MSTLRALVRNWVVRAEARVGGFSIIRGIGFQGNRTKLTIIIINFSLRGAFLEVPMLWKVPTLSLTFSARKWSLRRGGMTFLPGL